MLAAASAVPEGPKVSLTVSPPIPTVDQTVRFNASASEEHDEGNGRIVGYRFNFGDGTGTDWQTSSTTTHAYTIAGNYTASVTAKDNRGLTGSASVRVRVLPPPPPAPDVRPVLASLVPVRPAVGDFVNLTIVLLNRGTETAQTAAVVVTDLRPDGTTASLGSSAIPEPLAPSDVLPVVVGPFQASGAGNHTLRIRVTDVSPPEPNPGQGVLNLTMTVTASPPPPPPPPTGPQLRVLAALLDPTHPRTGQPVNLSVIVWNGGTASAQSATVDAYDFRPNGTVAFLGNVALPELLPPSMGETLAFSPFVASGVGNHSLRLLVENVTPPQLLPGGGELDIVMNVAGTSVPPPPDHNPPPLEFGPLALGLAGAAVASGAAAAFVLLRPRPVESLEPPPASPPDRSPPPIWPP